MPNPPADSPRRHDYRRHSRQPGIGLAVIGHAKGYRTVIVIPETQSQEKISLLRTLGAEVLTVPEKPYSDPGNYNHVAQRLAEEKGWFCKPV